MKVSLAKTAGFCYGVNRAVNTVFELLEQNKKVCTLGPIIHNDQLVAELSVKGVRCVENSSEVKEGETLVIRSHGVEKSVYETLKLHGIDYVDATCPFVTKIHNIVFEASKKNRTIIIVGDALHQEVIGIKGHAFGKVFVVSGPNELTELLEKISNDTITVVAQTTFNKQVFKECKLVVNSICKNAEIFDTICNATSARQEEARLLSKNNDVMIVVGGKHSSNTAKLFYVCKENCERTFLIETADEISQDMLTDGENIAVVAGASTPKSVIEAVIEKILDQ